MFVKSSRINYDRDMLSEVISAAVISLYAVPEPHHIAGALPYRPEGKQN